MEIHKPKAVHGWRELANEIGVIVIGVLIALGAEQVVETLHWQHQVHNAEEQLREDARRVARAAFMRMAATPCIGRRLDEVTTVIDAASQTGRLPAVGQLGNPPGGAWAFSSWNSVVAAQTAAHFERHEAVVLGTLAAQGDGLVQSNDEEMKDWTDLYTIVGPGRTFSAGEQASVRLAISRSVARAKRLWSASSDMLDTIKESRLIEPAEFARIKRDTEAKYKEYAADGIMCKPLADAPPSAQNGQSPIHIDLRNPSYF